MQSRLSSRLREECMSTTEKRPWTDYQPQPVTFSLIKALDKAAAPKTPKDIRDRFAKLILRHEKSGYLGLHVNLGKNKRKFICDARSVLNPQSHWTLAKAKAEAARLRVQHSDGRDFAAERRAERAIPTLLAYLNDTYGPWLKENRRSGAETLRKLERIADDLGRHKLSELTPI